MLRLALVRMFLRRCCLRRSWHFLYVLGFSWPHDLTFSHTPFQVGAYGERVFSHDFPLQSTELVFINVFVLTLNHWHGSIC